MTDTAELATAIEAVKRATPEADPWTAEDFDDAYLQERSLDRSIATILNAVVSGDLAEVIALRAEVNRRTAAGLTMARNLTFLEGDLHKAEARATAAEADADRLAEFVREFDLGEFNDECLCQHCRANALIVAHTQRVNAKEDTQ